MRPGDTPEPFELSAATEPHIPTRPDVVSAAKAALTPAKTLAPKRTCPTNPSRSYASGPCA